MTPPGLKRPGLDLEDVLLLSAIVLLPWAFGGVDLWAYRTASFLLVAAATISLAREGWAGLGLDRSRRWLIPAALLALWAGLQVVPMPPSWIAAASPGADALYRQTFPGYPEDPGPTFGDRLEDRVLAAVPEAASIPVPGGADAFEAEFAGDWRGRRTLSLHPLATTERLCWYGALLIGFLAVARRCQDRLRAGFYRSVLFANLLALSTVGLIHAATSNGKLLWVRATLTPTRPFGPYVNPTNFAGAMEMLVPWVLGFVLLRVRRRGFGVIGRAGTPLLVAAVVLGVVSGLATASKSAAVILFIEIAVLLVLAVRGARGKLIVLAGLALSAWISIPLLARTPLGTRVQQFVDMTGGDYGDVNRLTAWRSGWRMFQDFPLTGVGFGSFRDAFPYYMQAGEFERWSQIHNDYLELLIDGGLVAALLVLMLVYGFWRRVLAPSALRATDGLDLEQIGVALGLAALSLHAAFDFNHQIPANALLFVTLAAVAWSRSTHRAVNRGGA